MHQQIELLSGQVEIAETDNLKIRLGNLYLHHVFAFVTGSVVITCSNEPDEPNEHLMRFIEWEGGIQEEDCNAFRQALIAQYRERRMDLLYTKLGEVLEFIVQHEKTKANIWFLRYPHSIPLAHVPLPDNVYIPGETE